MSFGEQLRKRREELGISRAELADRLGVSRSAIGNYETGVSAPKEEVLLRLFDALGVDPNYLYRDAYRANGGIRSDEEQALLESYRRLSLAGRQTVQQIEHRLGRAAKAHAFWRAHKPAVHQNGMRQHRLQNMVVCHIWRGQPQRLSRGF